MKSKKVIVILAAIVALLLAGNYVRNRVNSAIGAEAKGKAPTASKTDEVKTQIQMNLSGSPDASVKAENADVAALQKEIAEKQLRVEFLKSGRGEVAKVLCSTHDQYVKKLITKDVCVESAFLRCYTSDTVRVNDTFYVACVLGALNHEEIAQAKTHTIKEAEKTRAELAKHDAKMTDQHAKHDKRMNDQHAATNALIRPPKGKSSPGAVNAPSGGVGANPVSTVVTTSSASSGNRASDLWAKFSTEYALGNSAKYCLTVEEMLADKAVLSASFKPATWDYLQDIYVNKCKPPKKKKWYQRSINTLAMVPKMFTQGTCLNSVFTDGDCNLDLGKAAIGYFGTIGLAKAVLPDWAQDKIGLIDRPQPHSQPSSGGGTNPPADTSGLTGPGTYDPYDGLVSGTTGTVDPNAPNANVFGDVSTANPGEFGGDSITPRPPMPGGVSSIDPGTVGVITTVTTITDVPTSLVGPSDGGAIDSSIGPVGGGSQTLIGPVEGLGGGPNIF